MIKEALQYLIGLGQIETLEVNGQDYSKSALHHITQPTADPLKVNTLSGITDYLLSKFDEDHFVGTMVQVISHRQVNLVSQLLCDSQRETYMIAEAFSPKFNFGQWYDLENFVIALQSCFIRNEDTERILKIVGNIKESAVKQYNDDGVTQQVTAKVGVAKVEDVPVPNPVMLAPYRTFIEVAQPESKFIFRMTQGNRGPECALFEADGGAWKLEAMDSIKAFLEEKLVVPGITVIS